MKARAPTLLIGLTAGSGELDGDALSGRAEDRAISGWLTDQDFTGTRPPT